MWAHSRRQFSTVSIMGKSFGLFASVPYKPGCRDTSRIFEASESHISVVKGINIPSGFLAQGQMMPSNRLHEKQRGRPTAVQNNLFFCYPPA
jgi:hypothetical protein